MLRVHRDDSGAVLIQNTDIPLVCGLAQGCLLQVSAKQVYWELKEIAISIEVPLAEVYVELRKMREIREISQNQLEDFRQGDRLMAFLLGD